MILNKVTLLFLIFLYCCYGLDRKISSTLNPGCDNCNSTLVYVKAEGENNSLHQIWDFTRGLPTVIFAIGSVNSTLNITWKESKPIEISVDKKVYSFALVFDKLYEYNDINDIGHLDVKSPKNEYSLKDVSWEIKEKFLDNDKEALIRMRTKNNTFHSDINNKLGMIEIKLDVLPYKDYASDLPHLIHSSNSTLLDVNLANLTTNPQFNNSRFALRAIMASEDEINDSMQKNIRRSLDDEHTPGVFEVIEMKTPKDCKSGDGGYLEFRPVSYYEHVRSVETSTYTYVSNFSRTKIPHDSTLKVFYKDSDKDRLLIQNMVVSFGETGDKFYKEHNYTSWSLAIGYGNPPLETFSLFVIVVICLGLGVPITLALSGITYVLYKRYKQRTNQFHRMNEDQ